MYQIEGWLYSKLLELTENRLPREVGGLIIDGKTVIEIDNHAKKDSAFEFRKEDIRLAVQARDIPIAEINDRVVLWHSHPSGGVGPSREDMRNRTPLKYHLVLAYVEDSIVPTWY